MYQNPTSAENVAGIALVLAGSMAYGWVRNLEMVAESATRAPPAAASAASAPQLQEGAAAAEGSSATAASSVEDAEEAETSKMLSPQQGTAHAR